ncbi:Membrane protein of ER body-like protein [Linum grandiflorum]
MCADRVEATAKLSVKERLNGSSLGDSSRRKQLTGKRRRQDDKWEHDLYHTEPRTANRRIDGQDLRLKLQKKNAGPAETGRRSGVRDLREKLSGTMNPQPVNADPPKLTRRSAAVEAREPEAKKVATVATKKKAQPKANDSSADSFLQSLGLEKYLITFQAEEVDMTALLHMTDDDLKAMGVPMVCFKLDSARSFGCFDFLSGSKKEDTAGIGIKELTYQKQDLYLHLLQSLMLSQHLGGESMLQATAVSGTVQAVGDNRCDSSTDIIQSNNVSSEAVSYTNGYTITTTISRTVILPEEKNKEVVVAQSSTSVCVRGVRQETEVVLESVYQKAATQEFFCPNCQSCIQKVVLRNRDAAAKPIWDLRCEQPKKLVTSIETQEEAEVDRYCDKLGKRTNFKHHTFFAVLSFLMFGLLPPVVYGFSFKETDGRDYKIAATAVVSLVCVFRHREGSCPEAAKDILEVCGFLCHGRSHGLGRLFPGG